MSDFLAQVDPGRGRQEMRYIPRDTKGMLVIAALSGEEGPNRSWVIRHDNVLDEEYFQGDWPAGLKTIDRRDEMHKRGWTYFRITGRMGDKTVRGTGRIPFVYAGSRRYTPWLKLDVGDDLTIVDCATRAYVSSSGQAVRENYRPLSFFQGLPRPWMGLHTIDTIRRDAAEQRIRFSTEQVGENKARVIVTAHQVTLAYTVDLEADIVEEIAFSAGDTATGVLEFSFLQNIDDVADEFVSPRGTDYRRPQQEDPGLSWLIRLAQGSLIK